MKQLFHWCSRKLHLLPLQAPPSIKKQPKRPPSLKINIIPQQSKSELSRSLPATKATTTVSEVPSTATTNGRHSNENLSVLRRRTVVQSKDTLAVNGNGERGMETRTQERRGTVHGAETTDGTVGGLARQWSSSASRMFTKRTVSLKYIRANMKRPRSSSDRVDSPMEEKIMSKEGSNFTEDSYIPRIAEHTKSWPYVMARNYFLLDNIKLFITFLINILLLTYQVRRLTLS